MRRKAERWNTLTQTFAATGVAPESGRRFGIIGLIAENELIGYVTEFAADWRHTNDCFVVFLTASPKVLCVISDRYDRKWLL